MSKKRRSRKHPDHSELADKIGMWFAIALMPLALAGGIYVLLGYPASVRGSLGHGIHGTFIAQHRECDDKSCFWEGTFTSNDGTKTEKTRMFQEAHKVGDVVAAVDSGVHGKVYPPYRTWDWLWDAILLVLFFGYVAGGVAFGVWFWRIRSDLP